MSQIDNIGHSSGRKARLSRGRGERDGAPGRGRFFSWVDLLSWGVRYFMPEGPGAKVPPLIRQKRPFFAGERLIIHFFSRKIYECGKIWV